MVTSSRKLNARLPATAVVEPPAGDSTPAGRPARSSALTPLGISGRAASGCAPWTTAPATASAMMRPVVRADSEMSPSPAAILVAAEPGDSSWGVPMYADVVRLTMLIAAETPTPTEPPATTPPAMA